MKDTIKVLIVEDNPGDIVLIKKMLDTIIDVTFEVTAVGRLDEGLKFLLKDKFDIILLDLCLPDSEGIDTFNIMKYNAPNVPIIVLTGLKDDIFAVSAVGRGAHDYLVKDEVNSKNLARSITNAMEDKDFGSELNKSNGRFHLTKGPVE